MAEPAAPCATGAPAPATAYAIKLSTAAVTPLGVSTESIRRRSVPVMATFRLRLPDSGEERSPNRAPETSAPATRGSGAPTPCATPIRATPIVLSVPIDVPSIIETVRESRKAAGTR